MLAIASCKKNSSSTVTPAAPTPIKLGLYEFGRDTTYNFRQLQINVSNIGTQAISYGLVFDTGSGGMVIDANGIVPASMITSSGFNFTGDSTVINGITITNQTSNVQYGDDATFDTVYGNLAYAQVTIGDVNGSVVIKRLPFFLYYKAVNSGGTRYSPHEFDVMGVSSQYDIVFANNAFITSPFTYYNPGTGLTKGFKMAALGTSNFSNNGYATFVPGVLTLGLTAADLSSSSGFAMSSLYYYNPDYIPIIPTTVTYGTKTVSTYSTFDTGTDPYNFIEDKTAPTTVALLPQNTSVAVATTTGGFNYSYTTSNSANITYLENPSVSGNVVSIFGLEFFLNNEFMLDYTDNKLGLKNK